VTLDAIATKLGIGHDSVQEMIGSLSYRKLCARWVPRLLTEDHKVQRKAITSEMLRKYRDEGHCTRICSVFWQATKVGFTISTLKLSGTVSNGVIWIRQERKNQRQCHQLRLWAQSSGLQRGAS
jgi:hypothetical protein